MSDQTSGAPKQGPALSDSVTEVQGTFPSDAALQSAIAALTLKGFDRAAFSLPSVSGATGRTPNDSAAEPMTDTDLRQARTMGTSMAGTIGAFAAAGATVATGGAAAVVIAAAAAVGAGSALAVNAAQTAVNTVQADERQEAADSGRLILAVTASSAERRSQAEAAMREAGATNVTAVQRGAAPAAAGLDSSSWTG